MNGEAYKVGLTILVFIFIYILLDLEEALYQRRRK